MFHRPSYRSIVSVMVFCQLLVKALTYCTGKLPKGPMQGQCVWDY